MHAEGAKSLWLEIKDNKEQKLRAPFLFYLFLFVKHDIRKNHIISSDQYGEFRELVYAPEKQIPTLAKF